MYSSIVKRIDPLQSGEYWNKYEVKFDYYESANNLSKWSEEIQETISLPRRFLGAISSLPLFSQV